MPVNDDAAGLREYAETAIVHPGTRALLLRAAAALAAQPEAVKAAVVSVLQGEEWRDLVPLEYRSMIAAEVAEAVAGSVTPTPWANDPEAVEAMAEFRRRYGDDITFHSAVAGSATPTKEET